MIIASIGNFLFYTVAFIIAISVLVAVHEWGHYLVGRWSGMKVLRYSIGFGKPFATWVRGKDQTEYCISSIPLGGYVRFLDSREGAVAAEDEGRAFDQRPIWQRILVLLAGPAFNFLFAILAYWIVFVHGIPSAVPVVGQVEKSSYAADAGLQHGDKIIAVGDATPSEWEGALIAILDQLVSDGEVVLRVEGENGVERTARIDVGDDVKQLTVPNQLFPGLGFQPWLPPADIVAISEGTPAANADLQVGDRITAVNDTPINNRNDLFAAIQPLPGQRITVTVLRNGAEHQVSVVPEAAVVDKKTVGQIGVVPANFGTNAYLRKHSMTDSIGEALNETWTKAGFTVNMLASMVTGSVSLQNVSGPIGIAQFVGRSAENGFEYYMSILAVISISLGILNLLPIPVLDGGQIVYQTIEAVKGSPMTERAQIIGQQVGIVALLILMSFAVYNDIARLPS
ncbi:MAG: RIP metalloprotease RseP [Pseudomonadota bacterium]